VPIPKPEADESEKDFIGRCMAQIADEFTDQEERAGVCYGAWRGEDEKEAPVKCLRERKSFTKPEYKLVDGDEGIWECYASTFKSAPDPYGDVVERGCFKKTLKENISRIKNLWNHNPNEPIGRPIYAEEDSKGLFSRNKLSLGVQKARETRELIKDGVINEVSIGYDTIQSKLLSNLRHLTEVRLWDISPVTFAANEEATVLSMKGLSKELKDLLALPKDISEPKLRMAIKALEDLLVTSRSTFVMGDGEADPMPEEAKVGRVLSATNKGKLRAAMDALQALLEAAGEEEDPSKSQSTDPPEVEGAAELKVALEQFEHVSGSLGVREAADRINVYLAKLMN
jgi:HK97 family phage prohead protease